MIINSMLDQDFYKFAMMQAVLHNHPGAMVQYSFKCRNNNGKVYMGKNAAAYDGKLNNEIEHLCSLRFQEDELEYLASIPYFKPDFIEYLRLFKLNKDHVSFYVRDSGELSLTIRGPWISTILFEVPLLAIISELYTNQIMELPGDPYLEGYNKLNAKIGDMEQFIISSGIEPQFADFGTRRRASWDWQNTIINDMYMRSTPNFVGTSNVFFAKKYRIKPIGTMAHEWLQAHQALGVRLIDSQKEALEVWAKEYRGELGIALSDVVGFDAFLRDFDKYFAKLFDGCRHDSGNPIKWVGKLIKHYKSLGIDPKTKTAVFSDGLNFQMICELASYTKNHIGCSFGIGTNLTNDMGFEPLQIVIKMVECNGQPVAKVSDSIGKCMCEDEKYLEHLRRVFEV